MILTTREILNFIYDILVANGFSFKKYQQLIDDASYLKTFMKQTTPSLLFESTDVTVLMNTIQKHDPLLSRSEKADELAISYYVSAEISKDCRDVFSGTSYEGILNDSGMLRKINDDKVLRTQYFNLLVRLESIDKQLEMNDVYKMFVKNLYLYNAGKGRKLGQLYSMIESGVTQWCGSDQEENLCLDDKHEGFALYEKVKFEENLDHIPKPNDTEELFRFVPFITVAFEDEKGKIISLDIDYALFELIHKLNQGYIQTADDRNNYAEFISFVNRMLQTGSLSKSLSIVADDGQKAIITQGTFGYKFKVVR